jgi:hypothetical protein
MFTEEEIIKNPLVAMKGPEELSERVSVRGVVSIDFKVEISLFTFNICRHIMGRKYSGIQEHHLFPSSFYPEPNEIFACVSYTTAMAAEEEIIF